MECETGITTSVYSSSEVDNKLLALDARLKALETTTPTPPTIPVPPAPPTVPPVTPTAADYLMTVQGTTISSKNVKTGVVTTATDANSLLQKNVDAGGITSVGPGLFPMSSHILISKTASIIGSGDATIFKPTVKTNLFLVEGSAAANVELANFAIEGVKAPTLSGNYSVRYRGSGVRGGKIHDLYIHDFEGYGVIIDSPTPASAIPSDIELWNLRLIDNDYPALGLSGRNITARNIKTRTLEPESSSIAIEVDHPHYVMDNITLDGFEVTGGKRSIFVGGASVLSVVPGSLKNITIKNGTITGSKHHGLDLYSGVWSNVVVDNVTMNNNPIGLYTKIAGVKYSNLHFANNVQNIVAVGVPVPVG